MRELVRKDCECSQCSEHERTFTEIKNRITEVPGPELQYYDSSKPVKVHKWMPGIVVIDGILYKGQKMIIPKILRQEMLGKIHTGHMGVQECKEHGRDLLFWPSE